MMSFLMKTGELIQVPIEEFETFIVENHKAIQPRSLSEWRKINSIVILKSLTKDSGSDLQTKALPVDLLARIEELAKDVETLKAEVIKLKSLKVKLLWGLGSLGVMAILLLWVILLGMRS